MAIGLKTHKLLWARSGNKCSFEECKADLIANSTGLDDESVIGDEAHIVAKSVDGPRGNFPLDIDKRDNYDNLILLCKKHHKIVDDQPNLYTVEYLQKMKSDHETWVEDSLNTYKENDNIDLIYASYIDEIVLLLDFENWNGWISRVMDNASISDKSFKKLERIPIFIEGRFWPNDYIDLEDAVYNIHDIINDFMIVFVKHIDWKSFNFQDENHKRKVIYTARFYKLEWHEQDVYDDLLKKYKFHVVLIYDLMIELTKASNLLIQKIRKYLNPIYREHEGKLLINTDQYPNRVTKIEYNSDERMKKSPYGGLEYFMKTREKRSNCIGKGISDEYLNL